MKTTPISPNRSDGTSPLLHYGPERPFEILKLRLINEFLNAGTRTREEFNIAMEEAAALANATGFPLLVFPELFAEKVRALAEL
jgi:hypothetical protein